jgi:small subunit ribosomal protein S9
MAETTTTEPVETDETTPDAADEQMESTAEMATDAAAATPVPEPKPAPAPAARGDGRTVHTIGRRKEAVCRIYLKPGSGKWDVNGRTLGDFFPRSALVSAIQQPFTATDTLGRYDVKANVNGGGMSGQAGALRLAVARALVQIDETHKRKLRDLGLLTRDARAVERKKPGRPKARKRFQFSKR